MEVIKRMLSKAIAFSDEVLGILALIGLVSILLVIFCLFFKTNTRSIGSNVVDVGKSVIYASYTNRQVLKEKENTIKRIMAQVSKEMERKHQLRSKVPIVEELDSLGNVISVMQISNSSN